MQSLPKVNQNNIRPIVGARKQIMAHRLLYLVGGLGTGGLERQLCYVLKSLDRQSYRPVVVVWNFHEDDFYVPFIRKLGVPLYSFGANYSGGRKLLAFRRMVGEIDPEVVHSYSFYTNFAAWFATLGTTILPFGCVRTDFARAKRENGPWLGRLSMHWPRAQLFNSLSSAEKARQCRGFFVPRQVTVVRNGVDLEHFQYTQISASGQANILAVGSLLPVKRWDRLLAAAAVLKQRGLDFQIRIVGEGPSRRVLEEQAAALGVTDRVTLVGHSSNIPKLLAECTFLVHTSDIEGCPNVVLEAMACGRAVVGTDAGDVPCLVDSGKSGYVVRCGDDAALVDRMETLIRHRELCQRMGELGRAKAEMEFGLSRLVSETLAAYEAAGWKRNGAAKLSA
jgi:glycosyltransferase involved in cell wall biosynthesis